MAVWGFRAFCFFEGKVGVGAIDLRPGGDFGTERKPVVPGTPPPPCRDLAQLYIVQSPLPGLPLTSASQRLFFSVNLSKERLHCVYCLCCLTFFVSGLEALLDSQVEDQT